MPQYIAFLRAINVGGHNVKMEHLRQLFGELGLSEVKTLIASGNVIFEASAKNSGALEERIEAHLHQALGYEVATFLRSPSALKKIAEHVPFADTEGTLYIGFLKVPPGSEAVAKLLTLNSETDTLCIHETELYWGCKGPQSDSKLSGAQLEKTLKMKVTLRNSSTVKKLVEK